MGSKNGKFKPNCVSTKTLDREMNQSPNNGFEIDDQEKSFACEVAKKYNLSPLVAELIVSRGYNNLDKVQDFLNPSEKQFYDPYLLNDMDRLVKRVRKAVQRNEKVLIFGDYDVDGVSASAILIKYFASISFYVDYFLPNRYIDGYGLTKDAILNIKNKFNPSLIITVDCGISCFEEVEYAKTLGIEIIVTDHHDIPEVIPDTIVVNAKLPNQKYPFKYLCGTGVAFKIVQALSGLEAAKNYLGICAIATIADIVPLEDENRAIVKLGMRDFDKNLPLGIKMLMQENKLDMSASSTDIAFKLAPKINAAGRMGDASVALKLYIKDDKLYLKNTIENLSNLNFERQALCNRVYEDAIKMLSKINIANYNSIALYSKEWDSGILGIVSARIANEFNRPTILLSEVGDELKGSARSVNDIDIFSAISSLKEVLETFGGHKMAAGLTIKTKNFKNFISSLNKYLADNYSPKDFVPFNNYDLDIEPQQISAKFVKDLTVLEPCGCGNPKPIFNVELDKNCAVSPLSKHPNHITINAKNLSIMGFNFHKYLPVLKNSSLRKAQIEFQTSEYKGKTYIKGIAKNFVTGKLDRPRNNDILIGEYLKQASFFKNGNRRIENFDDAKLKSLVCKAENELFGTLFVCSTFDSYSEFVNKFNLKLQHYIYDIISNSGLNAIILAPTSFENFGAYKTVVFLDPVLSRGYLNSLDVSSLAKFYIPVNKKVDIGIFKNLSVDRNIFGFYFKILSNFASSQSGFYSEIDLFKILQTSNKKISFKQFIFCLYVFIELNIFNIEIDEGMQSLKENKKMVSKLTNSQFYNQICLILKTIS